MSDHMPAPLRLETRRGRVPDNVHHPAELFRVRWTRDRWERDATGSRRWQVRYYSTSKAALRLAEGLVDDSAHVELTTYSIESTGCFRYRPKPPPPPRRRPAR